MHPKIVRHALIKAWNICFLVILRTWTNTSVRINVLRLIKCSTYFESQTALFNKGLTEKRREISGNILCELVDNVSFSWQLTELRRRKSWPLNSQRPRKARCSWPWRGQCRGARRGPLPWPFRLPRLCGCGLPWITNTDTEPRRLLH